MSNSREKEKDVVNFKTSLNLNQQQEFPNSVIGIPMVSYGQHGSFISSDNGILYPYPPVVYPVPMCMNSARVLPPIQNPTGYHMGSSDKRLVHVCIATQTILRGIVFFAHQFIAAPTRNTWMILLNEREPPMVQYRDLYYQTTS